MPYIGKNPVSGGFHKLDALTASATDTYSLTLGGASYFPETANQLLVSLNGVIQACQDSFQVSGSNLIFDSALTASDSIDFVVALGDVLGVGSVTDGAITTAKIGNDAVTKAKMGTNELDLATIKDSTGTNTAITIDSSGRVFKPATPAFHAYADDGVYQTTTPIPFDNTTINIGNAFDTTNYKYVVPVTGNYFIAVHLGIVRDDVSGSESLNVQLLKGNTRIQRGYFEESSSTGYGTVSFSAIHALNAGDELTVSAAGGADYSAAAADAIFSGYLIG